MILLAAGRLTRPVTIDDRRKARLPASVEVRISSGEGGESPKEVGVPPDGGRRDGSRADSKRAGL